MSTHLIDWSIALNILLAKHMRSVIIPQGEHAVVTEYHSFSFATIKLFTLTIVPCLHKYKAMSQVTIPKIEGNAREHVLLWYEQKEHEGCHATVDAEIISKIKQAPNALFQQAPDTQSIKPAFVARLC